MTKESANIFERHKKKTIIAITSFILLALCVGAFFVWKVLRDEVNRGVERFIVLREPRPFQDLTKPPSDMTVATSQGLEKKAYRLRVDGDGFIMPSKVHAKPDHTIVFLGGSTTECQFMEEEQRFPYLVGRKLDAALGQKINTLNTAKAGNNSLHCLFILQAKVLPLKPDIAVFMECINDLTTLLAYKTYWNQSYSRGILVDKEYNPFKQYMLKIVKGHAQAAQPADDSEFAQHASGEKAFDIESIKAEFRKNLELFIFLCRQHGVKPVLMTQFNRMNREYVDKYIDPEQQKRGYGQFSIDYYTLVDYYAQLNGVYRDVAGEQKVTLIDLDRLLPKTLENMYDAAHLTARGAAQVADIVAAQLAKELK